MGRSPVDSWYESNGSFVHLHLERNRIRAAELLLSVRQREADRMMRFVEIEDEIEKRIGFEEKFDR